MESNIIIFLVRQKFMFSKIDILYILFVWYENFSTMLEKEHQKKMGNGVIGKHKLNETGALNMK